MEGTAAKLQSSAGNQHIRRQQQACSCHRRAANASERKMPHLHNIQDATEQLSSPFHCEGSATTTTVALSCPSSDDKSLTVTMPASDTQLKALTDLCSEATFGKGAEAVNDPSYRKALALATDKFFTNFDLSAHDILTTIKTAMMPDAASVTAELYKLNIYRPGDFFKPHVDTPRGDGMFGSLVVCLPQPHTGGALLVRHKGQEQRFDFAVASANTVPWAAFYSDCEHEILPVETGHRITLTYNLYCKKSKQANGPHLPGLNVDSLSLYKTVAEAVADPHFMSKGGELAFGCEHAYPHTVKKLCSKLHTMLKGRDALCHKALHQLGLKPRVMAVTDWSQILDKYDRDGRHQDRLDEYPFDVLGGRGRPGKRGRGMPWEEEDEESDKDSDDESDKDSDGESGKDSDEESDKDSDEEPDKEEDKDEGSDEPSSGGKEEEEDGEEEGEGQEEGEGKRKEGTQEGEVDATLELHKPAAATDLPYCFDRGEPEAFEIHAGNARVMWVCKSDRKQLQWYAASYGNEPSSEGLYSSAAVVVTIPKWGSPDRKRLIEGPTHGPERSSGATGKGAKATRSSSSKSKRRRVRG